MSPTELVQLQIPSFKDSIPFYVHLKNDELVSSVLRRRKIWEAYETALFLRALSLGDTIVDIGANIGYFAVLGGLAIGKTGAVYAFEPNPLNYAVLEQNKREHKLDHVHVVKAALSDRDGKGELFLNETNFGDHQIYDDGTMRARHAIDLLHGSNYLSGKTDRLDFVKIDTQGAEYHVLTGLMELLLENRTRLKMIVELWPKGLIRSGSSAAGVIELLQQLEQPFYLIDHINGKLDDTNPKQLLKWIHSVEQDADNEGFINLYLGEPG